MYPPIGLGRGGRGGGRYRFPPPALTWLSGPLGMGKVSPGDVPPLWAGRKPPGEGGGLPALHVATHLRLPWSTGDGEVSGPRLGDVPPAGLGLVGHPVLPSAPWDGEICHQGTYPPQQGLSFLPGGWGVIALLASSASARWGTGREKTAFLRAPLADRGAAVLIDSSSPLSPGEGGGPRDCTDPPFPPLRRHMLGRGQERDSGVAPVDGKSISCGLER